jgi:hypothetical protein
LKVGTCSCFRANAIHFIYELEQWHNQVPPFEKGGFSSHHTYYTNLQEIRMNIKAMVLLSAGMGIGLIGVGYLISPQFMFGLYGISLNSVNELNMVRAAYGGLFFAFGLLFLLGGIKPGLSTSALVALLVFMSGFACGRGLSFIVDGIHSALIAALLALEIFYSAAAAYLLFQDSPTS